MHNQPQQPLSELEALRKHLQALLDEEAIVKATVEQIFGHSIESERLTSVDNFGEAGYEDRCAEVLIKALEACHITIRDDESTEEIVHIWRGEVHWLSFHIVEWEWMQPDGTWPWEHE